MIYTARGVTSVSEWVRRVLDDKETSAIESHLGTWLEEVARIVSGGFKPGGGVDLQRDQPGSPHVIELYAIQSANNTKSAGGRNSDVVALRRGAAALRASRRRVEMYIGVLGGRATTAALGSDPNIVILGSDDFWERISGKRDFRARLLKATTILSPLVQQRAATHAARIAREAEAVFGDGRGNLDYDKLADPPSGRLRRSV